MVDLVSDWPSDTPIQLDGMVGSLDPLAETALIVAPWEPEIRVFVTGDVASAARSMGIGDEAPNDRIMGLSEDVRLLVQGFVSRRAERRERLRGRRRPESPK